MQLQKTLLLFQPLCGPVDCGPPGSAVGFPRQEHWISCRFLLPGIELCLLRWQAVSLPLSHQGIPTKDIVYLLTYFNSIFDVQYHVIGVQYGDSEA